MWSFVQIDIFRIILSFFGLNRIYQLRIICKRWKQLIDGPENFTLFSGSPYLKSWKDIEIYYLTGRYLNYNQYSKYFDIQKLCLGTVKEFGYFKGSDKIWAEVSRYEMIMTQYKKETIITKITRSPLGKNTFETLIRYDNDNFVVLIGSNKKYHKLIINPKADYFGKTWIKLGEDGNLLGKLEFENEKPCGYICFSKFCFFFYTDGSLFWLLDDQWNEKGTKFIKEQHQITRFGLSHGTSVSFGRINNGIGMIVNDYKNSFQIELYYDGKYQFKQIQIQLDYAYYAYYISHRSQIFLRSNENGIDLYDLITRKSYPVLKHTFDWDISFTIRQLEDLLFITITKCNDLGSIPGNNYKKYYYLTKDMYLEKKEAIECIYEFLHQYQKSRHYNSNSLLFGEYTADDSGIITPFGILMTTDRELYLNNFNIKNYEDERNSLIYSIKNFITKKFQK